MIGGVIKGQTMVSGCVADKHTQEPLVGANIIIKGTYDGTITGEDGCFTLEVNERDEFTIVASFLGYQSQEHNFYTGEEEIVLNISLKESSQSLNAVTITAGSFEAGDKKRAAVMSPMDIYTTAGSLGDIGAALKTLPGTQIAPDDGRLLVRGGDASETRVLMDGVLASKPYYSKVPDLPTRGRFAPSLFEGTFFSTGGYSAEYGQALSSVLVLESQGVAFDELTSISLMNIGGELSNTWVGDDRSFSAGAGYYNFGPYNSLVKNNINWDDDVESFNGNLNFRQKGENGGLFKFFASGDYGGQSFWVPSGSGDKLKIDDEGGTLYINSTYHNALSEKTIVKLGGSYTYDDQRMVAGMHHQNTREAVSEGKLKFITQLSNSFKITWGGAWQKSDFNEEYQQTGGEFTWETNFTDHLTSAFAELEWNLNSRMAFRPGLRYEYSSQTEEQKISPRAALAVKTGDKTSFSLAWGHFYQAAQTDFLKYNRDIEMQKAEHFIFGLQTGDLSSRLFRAEVYHKEYDHLVTGEYWSFGEFVPETNNGEGYANGFDLFYRDKQLIKKTDFWISYSYIDSKRKFMDYSEKVVPEFISPHTLNVVAKHFVLPIRSQVGVTWSWNSGRPYHMPGDENFMSRTAPNYSDLGMNLSYLTSILGNYTIIHFSVSNVLERDQVLGYRRVPLEEGESKASLVTISPDVRQFMFLGVFISIN
ncbi:TonB-dependent receptor [Marinilabilia rubra]|uniref:TonB-dependent receptor n=1 Tax=Marinilabilia rubra TaxID=2162893 RepID=A0A2U2BAY9_9BACT|nr:TonB-dependent receptor [Marinilabilia rubra]